MQRGLRCRAPRLCENPDGSSRIYLTPPFNHAVSWSPKKAKACHTLSSPTTRPRPKTSQQRAEVRPHLRGLCQATVHPIPDGRIQEIFTVMSSLQNMPYAILLSITRHMVLAVIYALQLVHNNSLSSLFTRKFEFMPPPYIESWPSASAVAAHSRSTTVSNVSLIFRRINLSRS